MLYLFWLTVPVTLVHSWRKHLAGLEDGECFSFLYWRSKQIQNYWVGEFFKGSWKCPLSKHHQLAPDWAMWSTCNMWLIQRLLQNSVPTKRKGEIVSMSDIPGTVHCAAVYWIWWHYSCEKNVNCHEEKSKQLSKKMNCTYYKGNSTENWKNDIKWFIAKIDMIQWL